MNNSFIVELKKVIIQNIFNEYEDNHDTYRFGQIKIKNNKSLKSFANKKLNHKGYFSRLLANYFSKYILNKSAEKIKYFEGLYAMLEDDYSRELLVKVCAFRILGNKKIKLPMNNPDFWNGVSNIENKIVSKDDYFQTSNKYEWKLHKHNLHHLSYPIDLYLRPTTVYYNFVYKCYFYNGSNKKVEVNRGDYVIDADGCWGDTAVFFAHHAGENGKVYVFEFVPENMEVLSLNVSLNPSIENRIVLFPNPLWSKSDVPVFYESNGPGTNVSMKKISDKSSVIPTVTIDELVLNGKIEKIDFIKMDIEGAELDALKGAEQSLLKFKPKLAISLYHRISDYKTIPKYLNNLNIGYKFYFNHYTMHAEESVLFCICN